MIRFALPAVALLAGAAPAPALDVVSTSPSPYALAVPASLTQISVTFDAAPVVPPGAAFRVCGTMSGPKTGTVSVVGNTLTFDVTGDAWLPGEFVSVNLRADVQTAGGDPLVNGRFFGFTIAAALASLDWSAPAAWGASDVPYFIFGGDVDDDGHPDVVAPNEGTDDFSVFLNTGGLGLFGSRTDYGVGNVPSSVFGEDFDNDGDLDLASADIASGTMSVSLNHGDGTFAPSVQYACGTTTRQVHGGDFDGDNDVDLCATSRATGEVFLFYNQGDGTFAAGVPYGDVQAGPFAIRTGDLDGDGWLDIAVACQDADSVTVMLNDGDGTFTTTAKFRVGDGPWDMDRADMDGDGDLDIVTVSSFNDRLHVFLNDGTGSFPELRGHHTGFFPIGVFCADADGDGDIDAVCTNFTSGSAQVFTNDGAGQLALQATLPVDRSGSYPWLHDLDGDGDLDFSVVDELADTLFVFYNGDAPVDVQAGPPVASGARLVAAPNPAAVRSGTRLSVLGLPGPVEVDVFSVDGRRVRRLWDGDLPAAGVVAWDGRGADGRALPGGAYFVRARGRDGRSASTVVRLLR